MPSRFITASSAQRKNNMSYRSRILTDLLLAGVCVNDLHDFNTKSGAIQNPGDHKVIKMEEGKKLLSEIVEQDRGVKFVRREITITEPIQDDTYFMRRVKKPNTGIHIGSYKKQPKKTKNKLL